MRRVAALVLAAGRSARYRAAGGTAESKLIDLFRGEPLVRHAVRAACGARVAPVIVVTGHAATGVEAALAGLTVDVVHNSRFAEGLASSLRTGLAALPVTVEAVVVLLGDMPLVEPSTIDALVAAFEDDPAVAAVVPLVDGERGNPVLLARGLFDSAVRLGGDEGARRLLRAPGLRVVEVPMAGDAARRDIDEPAGFIEPERDGA